MDSSDVHSDVWLVLRLLGSILLLPVTLVLVLFRKRTLGQAFEPASLIVRWLGEAPLTLALSIMLAIIFVLQAFVDLSALAVYPATMLREPWTLFTSGFLHGNLIHLAWNLLALVVFGRIVEMSYGKPKWLLIFTASVIVGSLTHGVLGLITNDPTGALGASGGITGLIAAAMLSNPLRFSFITLIPLPIAAAASFYLLADTLNLIAGVSDGVAYAAHIGGLLIGAIISTISKPENLRLGWISVTIFSILILTLGLV